MRYLVRLITPPSGLVLDPFIGSGTTGIACVKEGFRCIGIEQDRGYIAIAAARIRHAGGEIEVRDVAAAEWETEPGFEAEWETWPDWAADWQTEPISEPEPESESASEPSTRPHPAPFSQAILDALRPLVQPDWLVLDPFAGIGRVHELGARSIGVELEHEWACQHPRTIVADALCLPFADQTFEAIVTSPSFGNRMADHHEAKDGSYRRTYRHLLGRKLTLGNSGAMQWGDAYRALHQNAWQEAVRVLKPGGRFILNISNHIRKGTVQPVVAWHVGALASLGLQWQASWSVKTPRYKYGQNHEARLTDERIIEFIKAAA